MALVGLVAAIAVGACGANANQTPTRAERTTVWHQLGSWSGRSSMQTESFRSETGALRVRWETSAPSSMAPAGSAVFRLTAHSAISGRPLQPVIEHAGVGSGTAYVQQDPNVFYLAVESNQVDWKFSVEEGIAYP
jgi:hypothetical protein